MPSCSARTVKHPGQMEGEDIEIPGNLRSGSKTRADQPAVNRCGIDTCKAIFVRGDFPLQLPLIQYHVASQNDGQIKINSEWKNAPFIELHESNTLLLFYP